MDDEDTQHQDWNNAEEELENVTDSETVTDMVTDDESALEEDHVAPVVSKSPAMIDHHRTIETSLTEESERINTDPLSAATSADDTRTSNKP